MKLSLQGNQIIYPGGELEAQHPVLEARFIDGKIVVVYDYMAFPKDTPARNLFAYDQGGKLIWRAEDIGRGRTDAYVNILSEAPFKVGNFSGFEVELDPSTGKVLNKVFTK
ncbi:hypothetical protein GCM10009113_34340 [Marinobacter szutsaonensis]